MQFVALVVDAVVVVLRFELVCHDLMRRSREVLGLCYFSAVGLHRVDLERKALLKMP